jgi:hypothetical protein
MRASLLAFALFSTVACNRPAVGTPTSTAAQSTSAPKDRVEKALVGIDADAQKLRAKFDAPKDGTPGSIAKELAHMVEVDQLMRESVSVPFEESFSNEEEKRFFQGLGTRTKVIDGGNTARVGELVAKHGWFRISVFGEDADRNGWLIVQHADDDIAFQKRILALLEPLVANGETSPSHYAYLYDRIASHEHRPQRYGTQGRCVGPETWKPDPIEDPSHVDERRNAAGLRPLADYEKSFVKLCHKSD